MEGAAFSNKMSVWDESARQYDAFEKKWHHYEKIARGLLDELPVRKSSTILELACGTGACTKLLAEISQHAKIAAIDSSKEMLGIAQENIASLGFSNVTFVLGEVASLGNLFSPGEFDLGLSTSAFWQFPDPSKVLTALHSILSSGASFGFNLPRWFPSDEARDLFRSRVREILARHGLSYPEKGSLRNQTLNYDEILTKAGFTHLKDSLYEFQTPKEMSEEWRAIPVFSDQFHHPVFPPQVSDEIRKEYEKIRYRSPGDERTSTWKILTAENA